MYRSTLWGFVVTAIIIAGALYAVSKISPQYGIDLQGGTELSYELDISGSDTSTGSANVAEVVKEMISHRLDAYGLKEIVVATQGKDRILVQLPGAGDTQSVQLLKQQVEETGTLDFMLIAPEENKGKLGRLRRAVNEYNTALKAYEAARANNLAESPPVKPKEIVALENEHAEYHKQLRAFLDDEIAAAPEEPEWIIYPEVVQVNPEDAEVDSTRSLRFRSDPGSFRVLHYPSDYKVSGRLLRTARTGTDEHLQPCILFDFGTRGARQFADLTQSNKDRLLAIVLDGRIMESATIQERIGGSGRITGKFTFDQVQSVVNILQGGSLPAKPRLISETTVGSMLGQQSIRSGIEAMVAGLTVVVVFMLLYYVWGGFVAGIALGLNLLLILAYVLVFRQTLTFPGIAGVLLTIGMAVDANILIFERVREELRKGKSLNAALGTGYKRAFWVIFDTNLTSLITGIVLFEFGTGPVKGFATTLIAGILASFFTSVFVTRLILSFFLNIGVLKSFPMMGLIGVPRIDFYSYRRPFVVASVLIIVTSIGLLGYRGKNNYGIDFTGGSKINIKLATAIKKTDLEGWIEQKKQTDEAVKKQFDEISTQTIDASEAGLAKSFSILVRGSEDEAAPTVEGGDPEAEETTQEAQEQESQERVRQVLEKLLQEHETAERALLLPDPFPRQEWMGEDRQHLEMTVNLLQFNPDDVQTAPEQVLRNYLSTHLLETFEDFVQPGALDNAGDNVFTGIEVATLTRADDSSTPNVMTFKLATTPYRPPPEGLEALRSAPRQTEVSEAVRAFFRGQARVIQEAQTRVGGDKNVIELSEPFPQVVTIGGRVASNLQRQGVIAFFIAIVAIIFYLSLRFEFAFGLAAIVALVHDVLITLGIMAMTDALVGDYVSLKINLPEVAALLTIIGYSVNDTIVVFDRIRENLNAGMRRLSFVDIANMSINQTLARTVWTSGTTLVVVLMLLSFGGESIKGFAFAFAIGLVTGTYSSVFVATPALIFFRDRSIQRRERVKAAAQATA